MVHTATILTLPLRTPRLRLRPFRPDTDAAAFHAYRSLPEVCRYAPIEPISLEQAQIRLREAAQSQTVMRQEGDVLWLGVEHVGSGRLIGDVSLTWHSRTHRWAELGCTIHPRHANRGYAAEAAGAMLDLAFRSYGFRRVTARIDQRHGSSLALARKLGMRHEATSRDCQWLKGEWITLTEWALLAHEWPQPQPDPGGAAREPHQPSSHEMFRELGRWRIG